MGRKTSANSSKPRREGFTLLETLVAIAAVVVVAAGLAAVFDSIGKTVAAGRRVSRVNEYGRLLEQQLRRDIDRMARDGVLVIRQQFADVDGDGAFDADIDRVALYEDQERGAPNQAGAWRRRRVDELLFFARGDFQSVRPAVSDDPAWASPRSGEAMIYYGHGMRAMPEAEIAGSPRINETNSRNRNELTTPTRRHTLGYIGANPGTNAPSRRLNPNVFANEWILLRQQTLLIEQNSTESVRPGVGTLGANDPLLVDKDAQVAGQPAAVSAFRSINRATFINQEAPLDEYYWYVESLANRPGNFDPLTAATEDMPGPQLSSGIVDIATTSIEEVRRIVNGHAFAPLTSPPERITLAPSQYNGGNSASPAPGTAFTRALGQINTNWQCFPTRPTDPDSDWESIDFMHAWMDNLMPGRASTHVGGPVEGPILGSSKEYADEDRGVRTRTEGGAADLLDILSIAPPATGDRTIDLRRRDRQVMGAFNLVAGCSELAIDWTFGTSSADPSNPNTGTVHWYGPETPCGFYEFGGNSGADDCQVRLGSTVAYRNLDGATIGPVRLGGYPITDRLIYGFRAADEQYRDPVPDPPVYPLSVSSFFGTIDPTYALEPVGNGGALDITLNGERTRLVTEPTYTNPDTFETVQNFTPAERTWRWPRMIRIRVTIADPIENGVEATFEYVFQIPDSSPQ